MQRTRYGSKIFILKSTASQFVFVFTGILSATGNGYVIYMTAKRKTKLKPPEFMTLNLAVFDFGISGELISCG